MTLLRSPLGTVAAAGDWMLNRIMPSRFLVAMNLRERWLARIALLMAASAVLVAIVGPLVAGLTGAPYAKTVVVVLVVIPVFGATCCLVAWGVSIVTQGIRLTRRNK